MSSKLLSRKSFITVKEIDPSQVTLHRMEHWREYDCEQHNKALSYLDEILPLGSNLNRELSLNKAKTKVGKTKDKWGYYTSPDHPCG